MFHQVKQIHKLLKLSSACASISFEQSLRLRHAANMISFCSGVTIINTRAVTKVKMFCTH